MKKFFASILLALASVGCFAQISAGDELFQNGDLAAYTQGSSQLVPVAWGCPGYTNPLQTRNRACLYVPGKRLSIVSKKAGCCSVNARLASPANPQWWQAVAVPVSGTYTLSLVVTKFHDQNIAVKENPLQAVVIKAGLTEVVRIAHQDLAVNVPTPISVPVYLKEGQTSIWFGTGARIVDPYSNAGYRYDFSPQISLTYAGF